LRISLSRENINKGDHEMNEGDRVVLQRALGPCMPAAEGILQNIDTQGNVVVEITHDHHCNPFTVLLPPVKADYYRVDSKCAE
jgi:hypothetical protein